METNLIPAANFATLIANMIAARQEVAAAHGITLTDDEIADSVKAALLRLARG